VSDLAAVECPYFWRWRARLPERHGQRCRIAARGTRNSVRVELPDGLWVITSRWAVRRAAADGAGAPAGAPNDATTAVMARHGPHTGTGPGCLCGCGRAGGASGANAEEA
jgi:hypothetical protein